MHCLAVGERCDTLADWKFEARRIAKAFGSKYVAQMHNERATGPVHPKGVQANILHSQRARLAGQASIAEW